MQMIGLGDEFYECLLILAEALISWEAMVNYEKTGVIVDALLVVVFVVFTVDY